MLRTHTCGELRADNIDDTVTLCGWVDSTRDHGGAVFVDLRDRYGKTQVVFGPESGLVEEASALRSEDVIKVIGSIAARPEGTVNEKIDTGAVELRTSDLEVLNKSKTPPFTPSQQELPGEDLRLKYRYLDLRRQQMQDTLVLRSKIVNTMRQYFDEIGLTRTPPLGLGRPPRGALPRLRDGRLVSRTDGEVMLFGYALRGTLLSIATAYTAFANEGVRVDPYLIDRVVKGDLEKVLPRGSRQRIMSAQTVAHILPMLKGVVHQGAKHPARIPGVDVGGKTGTSQKLVKGLGYQGHRKRYASFVGLAPLKNARYVVAVMLDAPKDRYGAMAAGPVFRDVAHFALTRVAGMELPDLDAPSEAALAVLRDEPADDELGEAEAQIGSLLRNMATEERRLQRRAGALPDFVGLDVRSALTELSTLDLPVKVSGSGRVLKQVPAPDTPISEIHGAVYLRLGTL